MWPRKGTISPGSDADIVIFDPDMDVTISHEILATNCDYNPFDGIAVQGWPITTLVRGRLVVRDRVFCGQPGYGEFIVREPADLMMTPGA
jgi:dihydropyrimidinase